MIDERLIRLHAPTTPGVQVHINHDGCPAGTDTKRRLYIKNNGTAILAYCHHCNEPRVLKNVGVRQTLGDIKRRLVEDYKNKTPDKELVLPPDALRDGALWSANAATQLQRYSILALATMEYGVEYSPSLGRILFPVYGEDGKLSFVAQRAVERECSGPKWLMIEGSAKPTGLYANHTGGPADTVVVVEDPISAIKVAGRCAVDAMCLFGTSLNDRQFEWLVGSRKHIIIFLDGDDAGINGSLAAAKRLMVAVDALVRVRVVTENHRTSLDPKDYSSGELRTILGKYGH
jgi:hypothetical protein